MSIHHWCRLCVNDCSDGYKSLYDENGFSNATYDITVKYFDPMLFNIKAEVVCLQCWHHILDFHNFRQSVLLAQTKLIVDKTKNVVKVQNETTDTVFTNPTLSDVVSNDIFEMVERKAVAPPPEVEEIMSAGECPAEESNIRVASELFITDIVVKEEVEYISAPEIDVIECPNKCHNFKDDMGCSDDVTTIQVISGRTRFGCKICGHFFQRKFNFIRHMMNQHRFSKDDINRECTSNKLSKRTRARTKPKVVGSKMCKFCGKYFLRKHLLQQHMVRDHNISKPCISRRNESRNAERKRQIPRGLISFQEEAYVLSNEYTSPPFMSAVDCPPKCLTLKDDNVGSDGGSTIHENHDRRHVRSSQKHFNCKVCGKFFLRKFNFFRHMINQHSFSTEDIKREYGTNILSKRKRNITKPKVVDCTVCKMCGKYFSRKALLHHHMVREHHISQECISLGNVFTNYERQHVIPEDLISLKDDEKVLSNSPTLNDIISANTAADLSADCDGHGSLHKTPLVALADGYYNDDREINDICKIELKSENYSDDNDASFPASLLKVDETRIAIAENVFQECDQQRRTSPQRPQKRKWKTNELDDYIAKWKPQLECRICNRWYKSFTLLQNHSRLKHPKEVFYISCCKSKFKTRSLLVEHIYVHANPTAFRCELCDKLFTKSQTLQIHVLKIHNLVVEKIYILPESQTNFENTRSKNIVNSNRNIDLKSTIACKVCGKHFSKQKLKRHMLFQHQTTRKNRPNEKDTNVLTSETLDDNEIAYTSSQDDISLNFRIKPKSVVGCKACGECFTRKFNLFRHLTTHHNILKNNISHRHYEILSSKKYQKSSHV